MRDILGIMRPIISTHSLTRRLTEFRTCLLPIGLHFNSQPHKEADGFISFVKIQAGNFNSQPHKEADKRLGRSNGAFRISTHSLTRRLTNLEERYYQGGIISTHSLTRRLTPVSRLPF